MENELSIDFSNPETIKIIKESVAQNTTDSEFQYFIELCKATKLNPIKKEIWCIVTGDVKYKNRKVQMMTGVNGFFTIANSNASYDGMKLNYGELIEITLPDNFEKVKTIKAPSWVECEVYRKDRRFPQVFRAYWHEYAKDLVGKGYEKDGRKTIGKLGIWAKMSSVMLAKCAKSMALRESFPQELNGLYTAEEMPNEYSISTAPVVQPTVQPVQKPVAAPKTIDAPPAKVEIIHTEKDREALKTPFSEDEIPENYPDMEEAPGAQVSPPPVYTHIYNVSTFTTDDARLKNFNEYCAKLEKEGVDFYVDDKNGQLFSTKSLKRLLPYELSITRNPESK